jgi:hypothetical protein
MTTICEANEAVKPGFPHGMENIISDRCYEECYLHVRFGG